MDPQYPYAKSLMLAIEPKPERERLRIKLLIKGEEPSAINTLENADPAHGVLMPFRILIIWLFNKICW